MATKERLKLRVGGWLSVGSAAARNALARFRETLSARRSSAGLLTANPGAAAPRTAAPRATGRGAVDAVGVVGPGAEASAPDDIQAPVDSGLYGEDGNTGEPLRLALFGDSLAVGVGAGRKDRTVGARLSSAIATASGRRVQLHNYAVAGSQSSGLAEQVDAALALGPPPEVSLIIVGGNDVLHRAPVLRSARYLYSAVLALRAVGCRVVVATCPDLGSVRLAPRPLRYYLRRMSRRLAVTQTIVVVRAGGRPVPLLDTLGPIFLRKPKVMFSSDHFHPSAMGYARAAALLAPSVLAASGHSGSVGILRSGAVRMPGR